MIGGNISAVLQVKDEGELNLIGEREHIWNDVTAIKGWLDLSTGDSTHSIFNAKIQQSTHIFICDFTSFKNLSPKWIWNPFNFLSDIVTADENAATINATSENARIVIDGLVYEILLIDNPMNMNEHLEIYLKFTGGQNGN